LYTQDKGGLKAGGGERAFVLAAVRGVLNDPAKLRALISQSLEASVQLAHTLLDGDGAGPLINAILGELRQGDWNRTSEAQQMSQQAFVLALYIHAGAVWREIAGQMPDTLSFVSQPVHSFPKMATAYSNAIRALLLPPSGDIGDLSPEDREHLSGPLKELLERARQADGDKQASQEKPH
jgi:hypothetical protein